MQTHAAPVRRVVHLMQEHQHIEHRGAPGLNITPEIGDVLIVRESRASRRRRA